MKVLINGKGFSSVVSSNSVTTCPYTFNFSFSNFSKDIVIDPCIPLSASRSYMYIFSYVGFFISFLVFLLRFLIRI